MRTSILTTVLLLAVPAGAQPVTSQPAERTCEVTISRAPDEVRDAIQAWVAAEPRCATTLDVRVVPSEGGFYLFAQDGAGRVRERMVPDAQSAGVLVASWVADDLIERHAPEPAPAPHPTITGGPSSAPVIAPPPRPGADTGIAAAKLREPHGRWLTVAGTIDKMLESGGVRVELDLLRRGGWVLGAGLARSGTVLEVMPSSSFGYISTRDTRAIATGSHTATFGRRWELRLAVGAGLVHTAADGWIADKYLETAGASLTAEISLMLACRVFDNWAFGFGAIATAIPQTYKIDTDRGLISVDRAGLEHNWFAAFRRRL